MDDAITLPCQFKHFEISPGKYRANLLNESDAKQWMEEYVSLTNSNWRVVSSTLHLQVSILMILLCRDTHEISMFRKHRYFLVDYRFLTDFPKRGIFYFSLEYNCHHTSYRRVNPNKNAKGKSKNCGCNAKLKIIIKHMTKDTKKKDKHVKVRRLFDI